MGIQWNKKYTTIAVYSLIVIIISLIFNNIISEVDNFFSNTKYLLAIFQPFLIGFVIAYLLNFILRFYENNIFTLKIFDKIKKSSIRGLSILLTYLTAGLFIYIFIQFVLPQLIESISGLINDIPHYVKEFSIIVEGYLNELEVGEEYLSIIGQKISEFTNWSIQFLTNLLPVIGNAAFSFVSSLWNIILGIIISVYLLIDKERFMALNRKLVTAFLNERAAQRLIQLTSRTNLMFNKFIGGQILDSAIIGVLIFIILSVFKMPYTLFLSVLMGCTNVIPFFGPFIGAIPSAIIILFASPSQFLWFIVIILVIQQIDGNLLGPKILGDSIGISPFWILFSILIFGKLFGFIGMVVAVPLFAVIYSIIKEAAESKLAQKGLSIETDKYLNK